MFATIPKEIAYAKGWKKGDTLIFMIVDRDRKAKRGDIILRKLKPIIKRKIQKGKPSRKENSKKNSEKSIKNKVNRKKQKAKPSKNLTNKNKQKLPAVKIKDYIKKQKAEPEKNKIFDKKRKYEPTIKIANEIPWIHRFS